MEELQTDKRVKKLIHIRLSENLHTRLKIRVAEQRTTIQKWVVRSIRNALRRKWTKHEAKPDTKQ